MERYAVKAEVLDQFLAEVLRSAMGRAAPVAWPCEWPDTEAFHDQLIDRMAFHGIALVLLQDSASLISWPRKVLAALREEARGQSFWELGHREVTAGLIEALTAAGVQGIFTKGTALAYSAYPEPAMRRRGDSDILISTGARKRVTRSLRASGFRRVGDRRPLQESWAIDCRFGFTHEFDVHWRINASPLLARALEQGGIGTRSIPLPRLVNGARALAPADNLVLVAINRASHQIFGYRVNDAQLFDQNRLIWALDVDLTCNAFDATDWQHLLETARATGTAPLVHSALAFAEARLGTVIPVAFSRTLAAEPGDAKLMRFLSKLGGLERLRLNLEACPTLRPKLHMLRYSLFPRSERMRERFPDTAHWPVAALYARRMWSGLRPLWRPGA